LSAEYYSADNDFSYQHDNNTKFNPHDDFQTKRSNNQVERKFVMLKGQQTFSHIESTGLVLLRDYTTGINNNLNQAKSAYIEQSSVIAALSLEPSQTSTQIWQAQLNLNQANHLYDDLGNEIGLASDKQEIEYSELTTNLTFKKPLSFLNSSSQINFSYLSLNGEEISQSLIKNLDIDKKHYSISQSFSNTNFQLSLSAGGLDSANKTQDYWSLGTHIFFDINSIDFLASAARKVRLPTTSELYLNQGNQSGNSDLTPEIFHEVSLKTQLNQSRYGIEMEGFYRQSQDSIVFSYNAQGVGRADNQGGSILYGVDIQAYAQLGSVQLDFSSSIMNSENQIRNNAYSGKYLPNIFHVTSFVRLQYPFNRWITGIEHHTQSGLYYDSANSQKAKDQSYLNATLEYAFKKGLIALKINNILDKQYTGFKTEPLPGRSGLLSIQYQL
jgi:outer membrane cobalamin receptor